MNKLPAITISFWIMKICATTLGETAGDLLSMTMQIGYAMSSVVLLSFFFVSLIAQLFSKKYHPFIFWAVILSTSTAGTTISDFMSRSMDFGYTISSLLLVTFLIITLVVWKATEKSLDVVHIKSIRAELFYWTSILFSNTLGTSLGDFLADSSGLGFSGGAILIGSLLLVLVLFFYFTKISPVILFWLGFILTRPFGATFGDFMTKPVIKGGMNLGTIGASLILFGILLTLIIMDISKIRTLRRS